MIYIGWILWQYKDYPSGSEISADTSISMVHTDAFWENPGICYSFFFKPVALKKMKNPCFFRLRLFIVAFILVNLSFILDSN
jgi:hypothetical protein